jgi:hypothetical protein
MAARGGSVQAKFVSSRMRGGVAPRPAIGDRGVVTTTQNPTRSPRRGAPGSVAVRGPRSIVPLLVVPLLVWACSGDQPAGEATGAPPTLKRLDPATLGAAAPAAAAKPAPPKLELFPIRDSNGEVCTHLPLPSDWQVTPTTAGKYTVNGPGGVLVNETESAEYAWSDDGFARESLERAGAQLAPPLPPERILKEGIEPMARAQGYTLVEKYDLPELQAFWDAFGAAMPATGARRSYRALGTDWQGPDGKRSCIVLLQQLRTDGTIVSWSVHTTELEAPADAFVLGKRTWLDALAHQQVDAQWQQSKGMQLTAAIRENQEESRRWMQLSSELHRQRMADIAAAGRTALETGRTNSEILDRSHEGFQNRSAASDAGQRAAVDGIHEWSVVVDPTTGTRYRVDAGHCFYWGDGDGGYFGTDDPNYDPRLDPALRQRPWVRFEPARQ